MPLESMSDRPILLFDGVCNLCDRSVQFVLDHDTEGVFQFASLQSEVGTAMMRRCVFRAEAIDSVVLVEDGQCHIRSEAAWRIATRLNAPWRWLSATRFVPRPVRDVVYDWVARNRYRWFGMREACRIPTSDVRARFLDAAELAPSEAPS
ncbi:hypothetical protein BSZ37_03215 [Rubrivirga marina]|uniref:Thiol-disulfide oxidoreductase DCC n=2 Tax=Rubrivirga marina TaxID=1196024 RepID=A0A271J5W1_9BACT|nr:hypothetical protein BSZ37_03215 [Rubrivirga marina]